MLRQNVGWESIYQSTSSIIYKAAYLTVSHRLQTIWPVFQRSSIVSALNLDRLLFSSYTWT